MDVLDSAREANHRHILSAMHVVRRRFEENPRKPKGEIYAEVGADFGLSAMSIRLRYSQWRQGGDEALRPKVPGRRLGDGRLLTARQEAHIRRMIETRTPEQCGISCALWNRSAVHDLIAQETGVRYSIEAVGKILHRWKMTVQKPVVRHPGRKPAQIRAWLKKVYPALLEQARAEEAESNPSVIPSSRFS